MRRRLFLAQMSILGLAACSLGRNAPLDIAHYDLGIERPRVAARLVGGLALDEISAAAALHRPAILYRLVYSEPAQLRAYSLSRWVASPAELVAQRLRSALGAATQGGVSMAVDGVAAVHLLRVELTAFEQLVWSAVSSSGLVRMRATLLDRRARLLRAQRDFSVEEACPSVDAGGAVAGLRQATDSLIAQMIHWLAADRDVRG